MNLTDRSKAIFLDRDGVVNKEVGYLSNPDEFELLAGTVEALKILKGKGYMLIIITNQAGIARGYYTKEILDQIHKKMKNLLKDHDIVLDDILYCPHHPDFGPPEYRKRCTCRKPATGMIERACHDLGIDPKKSYMSGIGLRTWSLPTRSGPRESWS